MLILAITTIATIATCFPTLELKIHLPTKYTSFIHINNVTQTLGSPGGGETRKMKFPHHLTTYPKPFGIRQRRHPSHPKGELK